MSPQLATLCFAIGLAILFALNRDRNARLSPALWLPVVWLVIGGSRNASEWLQWGGPTDAAERYLEGNAFDRNFLTGLILLAAGVLAQRSQRVSRILRANLPLVVFFLYCGLTILWSDYPFVAFKRWIRGLGDVVMVLVILTEEDYISAIKRVFSRVAFLLLPASVLLIKYYPYAGRSYGRWDGTSFWTGVASGKNGLGMICMVFGLASLWCFFLAMREQPGPGRNRRLAANGAVAAVGLWLLWHADSKTSLACFLLAGSLMTAQQFFSYARRPAVVNALVISLLGTCVAVLFLGVGEVALKALGREPTLTGRSEVWRLVLRLVEDPVLGAGYESFWLGPRLTTMAEVTGGINQAHNGYIETYLNLGLVGLALLILLILTSYRRIIYRPRLDPRLRPLVIAYFLMAIIYNFTEGSFKMMSPVWIAFLLSAMAASREQLVAGSEAARAAEDSPPEEMPAAERGLFAGTAATGQ